MDIEDLVEVSKAEKGCPYYAARAAAKDAEVVRKSVYLQLDRSVNWMHDIFLGCYVAVSNAFT